MLHGIVFQLIWNTTGALKAYCKSLWIKGVKVKKWKVERVKRWLRLCEVEKLKR
ncbi:hypothetical protein HMPREF1991_02304 [Hoylesella loescheii DSM 19665 = JCM 12249 = ATCC 15930]|uniref:Uncharacterized protein n=1 Tax=Hoylesella loescheii DSM 19665 = JCM 12249 = ATCC 15930 TaxID=1122985 RepID=A0A069QFY5_HOYLO|nr:hypothetical protein HMPREF1991_02304 [Hoylesella loescheii DSM 19665 = JCM 12249 = ATCC 15930]